MAKRTSKSNFQLMFVGGLPASKPLPKLPKADKLPDPSQQIEGSHTKETFRPIDSNSPLLPSNE